MDKSLNEILNSPVEEKISAVEAIWDSIENDSLPVTEEEIQIAKARYQEYLNNQSDGISWTEAKQKLMRKYGF